MERLRPPEQGRVEYFDAALPGFCLRVTDQGHKSWSVFYRVRGKQRRLTLGSYPAVDLADAREEARAAMRAAERGEDPAEARKLAVMAEDAAARETFAWAFGQYDRRRISTRRPRTQVEMRRPFTGTRDGKSLLPGALAKWGGRPLRSIERREIVDYLNEIVDRGAPIAANRAQVALSAFFNWCIGEGYCESNPLHKVPRRAPEQDRAHVLTDAELRAVWRGCERQGGPFAQLVEFLILTGQRRGEAAGLHDGEIRDGVWFLSAERTKNHQPHALPLPEAGKALLASIPEIGRNRPRYFFTLDGKRPIGDFSGMKVRLDEAIAAQAREDGVAAPAPWRLHDLRRTLATGLERLGINPEVRAAVLNHSKTQRLGITAVYSRHGFADEMRRALDAWAEHLREVIEQKPRPGNVVALAEARG
ncbi:MAG: site-specific integrase [Alphaproteobacteria bacterium]|nr:site-specific integrase [Alphaproteobacteria bacterium]